MLGGMCAPALAGTCAADSSCRNCYDNKPHRCTECEPGYELQVNYNGWVSGEGSGWCECVAGSTCTTGTHTSCQWEDNYAQDWYAKILIGTIVGSIVTIATTVVLSLPVCCGVMKDSPSLKVIAIVCSVVAFFCFFVPMIAGSASSGSLVDDICA